MIDLTLQPISSCPTDQLVLIPGIASGIVKDAALDLINNRVVFRPLFDGKCRCSMLVEERDHIALAGRFPFIQDYADNKFVLLPALVNSAILQDIDARKSINAQRNVELFDGFETEHLSFFPSRRSTWFDRATLVLAMENYCVHDSQSEYVCCYDIFNEAVISFWKEKKHEPIKQRVQSHVSRYISSP